MARPKKIDTENYDKLSMNIPKETKNALELAAQNYGMKTGPYAALLIDSILSVCSSKKAAQEILFTMMKYPQKDAYNESETTVYEEQRRKSNALCSIIQNLAQINQKLYKIPDNFSEFSLATGLCIAVLRKDWVKVNPEDAINSNGVVILTCRNNAKFDFPYLVIFVRYGNHPESERVLQPNTSLYAKVIEKVKEKFPEKMKEILDLQVPLPTDPMADMGEYINAPNLICIQLPKIDSYKYIPEKYPNGVVFFNQNR